MIKLLFEFVPLLLVLGVYFNGILALTGKSSYDPVGPYKFPLFLCALAALLALVLLFRAIKTRQHTAKIHKRELLHAALIFVISGIYLALLTTIGYVLLTPVYIAATLLILGQRNWKKIIVISVMITAILYIPFRYLFNVLFPQGLLPKL